MNESSMTYSCKNNKIPDRSDMLKMVVITMRHGTLSGSWALKGLMASSFLQTSWGCTDRTPASVGRKAGSILPSNGEMSALTETLN